MARFAFIHTQDSRESVAALLPVNYEILGEGMREGRTFYVIGGIDTAGWTLDEYVIPRLASGLKFAEEVTEDRAHQVVGCSGREDELTRRVEHGCGNAAALDAALQGQWENIHTAECPITSQRADLLREIAQLDVDRGDSGRMAALLGAVPEYDCGGDQEVEGCECGAAWLALPAETLVRLKVDVDRYPHFIAPAGATGTVVDHGDSQMVLAVRLDEYLPGAEEWENEVQWYDEPAAWALSQVEVVATPTGFNGAPLEAARRRIVSEGYLDMCAGWGIDVEAERHDPYFVRAMLAEIEALDPSERPAAIRACNDGATPADRAAYATEAAQVRAVYADDPTVSNEDYGRMVEEADERDQERDLTHDAPAGSHGFTVVLIDSEDGSEGDFVFVHSFESSEQLAAAFDRHNLSTEIVSAARGIDRRDRKEDTVTTTTPSLAEREQIAARAYLKTFGQGPDATAEDKAWGLKASTEDALYSVLSALFPSDYGDDFYKVRNSQPLQNLANRLWEEWECESMTAEEIAPRLVAAIDALRAEGLA